ncbi:YeeE/YedE family protein [Halobacteriovorax sp. HLS]|uniref:YeeE/YedE family protein n=1 Tax=Halobacteriovorax sp. HLS TaxID=2234000 RepID=UPI000FDC2DBF|nr:YeeE/YedE thiosulfate transporter family protein [Halobacteriovorax sp. HLS]
MENILNPLLGGVIIGLATTLMMAFNGKITGISGIVGSSLSKFSRENFWRYSFLLGLILGGVLLKYIAPQFFNYEIKFSFIEAIVAGLLVGIGTRLGSGCTSGHGVCGLPRLSARSLIATITFMGFGILTVFIKGLL